MKSMIKQNSSTGAVGVFCLWLAFAVTQLREILTLYFLPSLAASQPNTLSRIAFLGLALGLPIFFFVTFFWIIANISKGKRWAFNLYSIAFIVDMLYFTLSFRSMIVAYLLIAVIRIVLEFTGLVLVYIERQSSLENSKLISSRPEETKSLICLIAMISLFIVISMQLFFPRKSMIHDVLTFFLAGAFSTFFVGAIIIVVAGIIKRTRSDDAQAP